MLYIKKSLVLGMHKTYTENLPSIDELSHAEEEWKVRRAQHRYNDNTIYNG